MKPYINAEYYNNVYKPNKNARIQGTFNKVSENIANFDAFRTRASEIVDRLLGGKISKMGGLGKMSDTNAKELIKKATGAYVEFWFNKGFVMNSLNSTINIGSLSAQQIVETENFRDITPFSVLANLQRTGMWDHKAISVSLSKELSDMGIGAEDILTVEDAKVLFELKDMGLNFHIEAEFDGELTGLPNQKRWIQIASTPAQRILMSIVGGTQEFVKTELQVQRDPFGVVVKEQAIIYSTQITADTPNYWYKLDGDNILIYMEVKDDQAETVLTLSNEYADDEGNYGVLGSLDNSNGLTQFSKISMIDHITSVSISKITKYNAPNDILNENLGTIGFVENQAGDVDIILKTDTGVVLFKDFASLKSYIDTLQQAQQAQIDQNTQAIAQNTNAIGGNLNELNLHTQEIATISTNLLKKQKKVGLYEKNGDVGVANGKFTSKDENGARQEATDLSDLTDKEYVDKADKENAKRIDTLEKDTLKQNQAKTTVSKHNKVITEEQEEQINDRLDELEEAKTLDDKVFNGTIQAEPHTDLTQITDQNGDPFEFSAGKMIQVFIKNKTINTGKGYLMKVGDTTKTGFVIPKGGGVSEHIDATLNTTGIIDLEENGSGTLADYEIYRMIEAKSTSNVKDYYTKTQVNDKMALKANKSNTYTKAQVDAKVKENADVLNGTIAPPQGNPFATKTLDNLDSVGEQKLKDVANETFGDNFIEIKDFASAGDVIELDNLNEDIWFKLYSSTKRKMIKPNINRIVGISECAYFVNINSTKQEWVELKYKGNNNFEVIDVIGDENYFTPLKRKKVN